MHDTSPRIEFFAHLNEYGHHQLVQDHLLSVAQLSRGYASKIGVDAAGAIIGLLHDIGKYSTAFQHYLQQLTPADDTEQVTSLRGSVDHSTAGAQIIWQRLKSQGTREGIVGELLALCVASHHSGLIDCVTPGGADKLIQRMDKAKSESHREEAWTNADTCVVQQCEQLLQDPQLIGGISSVIAKICQKDASETLRRFKIGLLTRFLFSCLIDADRTDTADSANPAAASLRQWGQYVEWSALAALLERKLIELPRSSAVDLLRKQVSDDCLSASVGSKGIYTLTVPTGGGKTLSSLRFALNHAAKWSMDRVIYVSPYTSIIDQNAAVVRRILEDAGGSVVLEHHSNLTPLKQTWKNKVLSENWDAPVVFTTGVQLLEALFGSGTRAVRRMHQMANAVLIFDEIQTLPVRCVHLFNNAVNFLVEQCSSSVVLCTATQPLLHDVDRSKGALIPGTELMTNVQKLFGSIQRHRIFDNRKSGGWEHLEVAKLAIAETQRAGSCLVVVNTKAEALAIFKECRRTSDLPVFHLSTNMCPAHRLKILHHLKKQLKARKPVICVSTQLIEAGVDISFGSAIRALAGLDSIAQTAGRCNRHGEAALGHVHVVNLIGELPRGLRDIRKAQEVSQRVLDENRADTRIIDLSNPKLIEQYFRYYFFDRKREMDYPVKPEQVERDDTLLNMLSQNIPASDRQKQTYMRQAFKTAAEAFEPIDSKTQGVIVRYMRKGRAIVASLCQAHEPMTQFALLKKAQRFTVNVFPWTIERLNREGALHEVQEGTGIFYLNEQYYDETDFGLNLVGNEEMDFYNA